MRSIISLEDDNPARDAAWEKSDRAPAFKLYQVVLCGLDRPPFEVGANLLPGRGHLIRLRIGLEEGENVFLAWGQFRHGMQYRHKNSRHASSFLW